MFLVVIDTRDGSRQVGFEDAILRTPKDITGNTRHALEEFGRVERRSELGVAEDSTPGKSRLYKATPTPIMRSLLHSLSKLSFPLTPIFAVSGDGLHSQAMSFSIVLTHPFITWTIFLLIILSRPTLPLFSPLSDNPHSSTSTPLCQETRTPVTFFLFLFTMDALLLLPLTTFPLRVLPNRLHSPPSLVLIVASSLT